MDKVSQYIVHKCSKCSGDTEYYCKSCVCDLCSQCRENHMQDLKTVDHNVVLYKEKLCIDPDEYEFVGFSDREYRQLWNLTDSPHCTNRKLTVVLIKHETENGNERKVYHMIRNDALFYNPLLLQGIEVDFKACHTKFQSAILTKAQKLKDQINIALRDIEHKHRCFKQNIKIKKYLAFLHINEQKYERSANRPIRFLKEKFYIPQIKFSPHLTLHTSQLSFNESLSKKDVIESMSQYQITEKGKRREGNKCLQSLIYPPKLQLSRRVAGVNDCCHISVSSDRIWVSATFKIILTNKSGDVLECKDDVPSVLYGLHTWNSESELIYIDRNYNINKQSSDLSTTNTFIEKNDSSTWKPQCVYWSSSTEELLVGMYTDIKKTGKVTRYDQNGQLTQTIEHHGSTGLELYKKPNYITENNNRDVIVSDWSRAVVVTKRGGRYRFSCTKHASGKQLQPRGICTDPLSHILVCDHKTVLLFDKDGQFLSNLLSFDIFTPYCLSYDANTNDMWVGSWNNNSVYVYRYIYHGRTI